MTSSGVARMRDERWRAYSHEVGAQRSEAMRRALEAFDALDAGGGVPRREAAAERAARRIYEAELEGSLAARDAELRRVGRRACGALLRFEANQLRFDSGGADGAAAVYASLARPQLRAERGARGRRLPHAAGSLVDGDGCMVARAAATSHPERRDDRCAAESISAGRTRRRELLRERHGFLCMCARCEREAGDDMLSPVRSVQSESVAAEEEVAEARSRRRPSRSRRWGAGSDGGGDGRRRAGGRRIVGGGVPGRGEGGHRGRAGVASVVGGGLPAGTAASAATTRQRRRRRCRRRRRARPQRRRPTPACRLPWR